MKPALHYSTLSMLSRCGMQAYYRYVEGIRSPPGVALHVGHAVHRGTELDLASKMATGALLSDEALAEVTGDALDANWQGEGVLLDDEDRDRGEKVVRGEAKDEAIALASVYHRELAPTIEPIALERKMRLELPGFPFDLEGAIDVEEKALIRDKKTAKRSPSGDEAEGNPQLHTYSMMASLIDKAPPKPVALDFMVKLKTPKAVTVYGSAPAHFEAVVGRIERAAKVFETGAFMPVDPIGPSSWVCSRRFCGYFDRCPFGARARVSVSMNTTSNGG